MFLLSSLVMVAQHGLDLLSAKTFRGRKMSAKEILMASSTLPPLFISSSSNRSTSDTNTVTAPSDIQNGDLLVAFGVNDTANGLFSVPTGFTVVSLETGSGSAFFLATKIAVNESGNYAFTWLDTVGNTVSILVYRNASVVNVIGAINYATGTTGTANSVTPTFDGILLAAFGLGRNATISTPPSGMNQRVLSTSQPALAIYDQDQNAGSTGTKSVTWSQSSSNYSTLFQVTNEPNIAPDFIASAKTQTGLATSISLSKPTGTIENDLMVALAAAGDNDISAFHGAPDDLFHPCRIVADHRFEIQIHPQRGESLGHPRRVGIDDFAEQDFCSNGDDFSRGHRGFSIRDFGFTIGNWVIADLLTCFLVPCLRYFTVSSPIYTLRNG
jgi:hypothetical protein